MLTNKELQEKIIEQLDEQTLVDLLGLTTQDIVLAFSDRIEDMRDYFLEQLE